jgi:hypothetical protein
MSGGGGIRTHGGLATTTVFETVRFVHSRTPPTGLSCFRPLASSVSVLVQSGVTRVTRIANRTGTMRQHPPGSGRWQLELFAGLDPSTGRPRPGLKTFVGNHRTGGHTELGLRWIGHEGRELSVSDHCRRVRVEGPYGDLDRTVDAHFEKSQHREFRSWRADS